MDHRAKPAAPRWKRLGTGLLAAALWPCATAATAQAMDAGSIERTIPTRAPDRQAQVDVQTPDAAPAAGRAGTRRFTLGAVALSGNSLFADGELNAYFEPYLASEVDEARLHAIAAAITAHYRRAGYLLSYAYVPPQAVEAGIAQIRIVEGRVDRLNVEMAGTAGAAQAVRSTAAPLLRGGPLRSATMERALGLLRDTPGLALRDVSLVRSQEAAALHALNLIVDRDRAQAFVYTDNRGDSRTGRARAYASGSLYSLVRDGDEFRLDLFAIPGRSYRYLYVQGAVNMPVGHDGLRLGLLASRGWQDQDSGGTDVGGASRALFAQIGYPVLRSRSVTLVGKLSLGDIESSGDLDQVRSQRDRLRVAKAAVEWVREGRHRISGQAAITRGLPFGAMTRAGDPLASRPDASGRFTKFAASAQLTGPIAGEWAYRAHLAGQYADRPLLAYEEFALGGNPIGRAFAFNRITGDHGLGAGAELSHPVWKGAKANRLDLFGFADAGATFESRRTDGDRAIASVGAGMRLGIAGFHASAEVGVPVASDGGGAAPRLFLSLFRTL